MAFEDSSHEVIYQSSHNSELDDDYECDKLDVIRALNDNCNLFFIKMKVYKEKCTNHEKKMEEIKIIVNSLKSSNDELKKDLQGNLIALSSMETLKKENDILKKELESVNNTISKFHKGKGDLDNRLTSQRTISSKYGIGYEGASTSSTKPIVFVKSSTIQTSLLDAPKVEPKALKVTTKGKPNHIHHNEPKKLEKSKLKAKVNPKPKGNSKGPKPKGNPNGSKAKITSKPKAHSHGSFKDKPKFHKNRFARAQ